MPSTANGKYMKQRLLMSHHPPRVTKKNTEKYRHYVRTDSKSSCKKKIG